MGLLWQSHVVKRIVEGEGNSSVALGWEKDVLKAGQRALGMLKAGQLLTSRH